MKILCVLGQYQYGKPKLGAGTEYVAFTAALRRLGHEVLHFESWDRSLYKTHAESNRLLLEVVDTSRPDVLLSVQLDCEIWLETLEAIRSRGDTATISWTTDDSWKYKRTSKFIGKAYDAMTTTYDFVVGQYQKESIPVLLTQWAANADWLREPLPASECKYAVTFVGAAHDRRKRDIQALQNRGIPVECFGAGWPRGPVDAERIPTIMRESLISVNFARAYGGRRNQIKARTFEVPGAGGLLLTDFTPGLEHLYDLNNEIVVYRDLDDLAEKVNWISNNPSIRDQIAWAGFSRTQRDHTYDRRMEKVLEFAITSKAARAGGSTQPNFTFAVASHTLRPWQVWWRDALVFAASTIWGNDRGPRAARRIVFEFSLRVFGRKTFTASGLPGRLFPEQ